MTRTTRPHILITAFAVLLTIGAGAAVAGIVHYGSLAVAGWIVQ